MFNEIPIVGLFTLAQSEFGKVQIFINFAGIADEFGGWHRTVDVNFVSIIILLELHTSLGLRISKSNKMVLEWFMQLL